MGDDSLEEIQYVMERTGFELIDDRKSKLIEEVKNLIISTIHQKISHVLEYDIYC